MRRPPAAFRQVSLSPDGRTAAVERRDAQGLSSVWTIDLESGSDGARAGRILERRRRCGAHDGSVLAYSIATDSPPNIAVRRDRGAAAEQRITKSAEIQYPGAFTPDARTLLFRAFSNDTGWDLFTVPLDGGSPQRLLQTPADENEMSLSPDGRLLAYTSNESGRTEVYVSRFPEMSNRAAVSSGGGQRPMWRGDGRELFLRRLRQPADGGIGDRQRRIGNGRAAGDACSRCRCSADLYAPRRTAGASSLPCRRLDRCGADGTANQSPDTALVPEFSRLSLFCNPAIASSLVHRWVASVEPMT